MFAGYWRRPEATVDVLRNLWFHTGDLGKVDDDRFLYFVDRKKDYLRRRGENISSFEMERTFVAHPAIKDVAVHAVASAQGEDDVKVTAVLQEGVTVTEEELCRWSVDQVPYFAVPRYIEFRDDLPRNPVGRVLKYELRDDGVTERDLGPRGAAASRSSSADVGEALSPTSAAGRRPGSPSGPSGWPSISHTASASAGIGRPPLSSASSAATSAEPFVWATVRWGTTASYAPPYGGWSGQRSTSAAVIATKGSVGSGAR